MKKWKYFQEIYGVFRTTGIVPLTFRYIPAINLSAKKIVFKQIVKPLQSTSCYKPSRMGVVLVLHIDTTDMPPHCCLLPSEKKRPMLIAISGQLLQDC